MPSSSAIENSIDVLQLLTAQHAEVDELFTKIEDGAENRTALLTELADKLAAHATVEETILGARTFQIGLPIRIVSCAAIDAGKPTMPGRAFSFCSRTFL